MKITENLPQYEDKKAVFVVTGSHTAVFYSASNGNIEKIKTIQVEKIKYSDNEGYFETRSSGDMIRSGFAQKDPDEIERSDFLKQFKAESSDLYKEVGDTDEFYLFSPPYMVNQIKKAMPDLMRKKTTKEVRGNYIEEHPFELIKKAENGAGK
jgi:hypothetical protein